MLLNRTRRKRRFQHLLRKFLARRSSRQTATVIIRNRCKSLMKYISLLIIILFYSSCDSTSRESEKIEFGIYESSNNGFIELKEDGKYRLRENIGNSHAIMNNGYSEGNFVRINDRIISLTSDKQVNKLSGIEEIELDVRTLKSKSDSITLNIVGLEELNNIFKNNASLLLNVYLNDDLILHSLNLNQSDNIQINEKIGDFSTMVFELVFQYNNRSILGNSLIQNPKSSSFELILPELSPKDFEYIYLIEDYQLIKDDKINWNGQEYTFRPN
jgi:hypothetical protein